LENNAGAVSSLLMMPTSHPFFMNAYNVYKQVDTMAKTTFSQAVLLDATKRLQLLLLDCLMASGNWTRDDIRFQGGTCLSLVYGSARFSEDLDFLLGTDRGLNRMLAGASARMTETLRIALPGATVRFSLRDDSGLEGAHARNPRTFTMSVAQPDWHKAVRIKVEFWLSDPEAVAQYGAGVRTARVLEAAREGAPLRLTVPPVLVNAANPEEILVDKLHALVGRKYLKHRDVFDLWWLRTQGLENWSEALVKHYANHARMYAGAPSIEQLAAKLALKAKDISALMGERTFPADLKRWLGADSSTATQASADALAESVARKVASTALELEPRPNARRRKQSGPER
jgi:hypothetical protein